MTKDECNFDTWFTGLSMNIYEQCQVNFNDEDSVREDYDAGRDLFDVADKISGEYV